MKKHPREKIRKLVIVQVTVNNLLFLLRKFRKLRNCERNNRDY